MTRLAIEVEDLTVRYGTTVALNSVTFDVKVGTVLGVLGRNGAGKTTLIRVLATQRRPTSGRARVADHDVAGEPRAVRRRIGVTGQYAALDDDLTAIENLELVAALSGLTAGVTRREIDRLVELLDLTAIARQRLGQLSGGTKRRVDLAAGLVASPEVIFLDESTTGLDPHGRQRLWALVAELAREGRTIVLTTQYLEEADQLADYVLLFEHGAIVAAGTPRELKASIGGQVVAATLGDARDAARVRDALTALSPRVSIDRTARLVAHATDAGNALEIVAAIDRLDVSVEELAVNTPTLDDAFYALTAR